jgi:hypothetical protein
MKTIKPILLAAALSLAAIPGAAQTIEPVDPAEPVAVAPGTGSLRAVVLPVLVLILVTAAVIADD